VKARCTAQCNAKPTREDAGAPCQTPCQTPESARVLAGSGRLQFHGSRGWPRRTAVLSTPGVSIRRGTVRSKKHSDSMLHHCNTEGPRSWMNAPAHLTTKASVRTRLAYRALHRARAPHFAAPGRPTLKQPWGGLGRMSLP